MKAHNFTTLCSRQTVLMLLFAIGLYLPYQLKAQFPASSYGFTASSGTFTEITGGTNVTPAAAYAQFTQDDAYSLPVPLGFTFNYCGSDYTQLVASSNGWVSFGSPTGVVLTNSQAELNSIKPALFPLWDDLGGGGGTATYLTSGTAPNRVFTIQYKNWRWTFGSNATISFQVKLYETTNIIQFVYRQETAVHTGTTASIGICDGAGTPTFLSLNNATAAPVASAATFTTNINTRPATGQIYEFTPPPNCSGATGMPTAGTTTVSPTSICVSGNVTLTCTPATAVPAVTGITYKWQSSPNGTAWTDIPGAVTNLPTYTTTTPVTAPLYFRAVMLCNGTSTVFTASASQQLVVNNPGTATVTNGARCGPGSVALSATPPPGSTINWYATPTGGLPIGNTNAWATPYIPSTTTFYAAAASGSAPATPQVGTATNISAGTAAGPFNIWFRRSVMQFLYTGAEIVTAGGGSGTINSIAFNCTAAPAFSLANYTVKITTVPSTMNVLTWQPAASMTTVFNAATYSPVAGWQTVNFNAPFPYNGVDNIVIELCWDYTPGGINSVSGTHQYTNINGRFLFSRTDATGTSCGLTGTTTSTNLPNIRFGMTLGCEGPRVPVVATVNPSPVVARTSPAVVCNDAVATISLTPPTPAYSGYVWSPLTDLYTDPAGTIPYTGTSATNVYMRTTNVGEQTYYMMAGNPALTTGCTYADTVRIWSQPGEISIKGMPDTICLNGSTQLSLDTISGYYPGSIQWQQSTDGTTYSNIGGATTATYTTPNLTFGQNTYYKAVVSAGTSVCESPVKYVVISNPTMISAPDSFHCGPGSVTLNAVTGGNGTAIWYDSPVGGLPLATGSTFVTPYLANTTTYYVSSGGGGLSGEQAVGAGNLTTAAQSSTPFSSGWGGSKHQYLIRASELLAAGIPAGATLTSIALDVVTGGVNYPGFAISMKHTNINAITGTYETGLSEVKAPANHTTTPGINTFVFDTPFPWDGISNIVVQTCWSNATAGATTSTVRSNTTPFVSSRRGQSDNQTPANMCAVTTPSSSATYSERPKFIFGYDNRCETDRHEVKAYIHPVPDVDLGADINKCIDGGDLEVLDAGVQPNGPSFLWDDMSTSQVRAVGASGIYHVTVTNQYGCQATDSVAVTLRLNPEIALGRDTSVCHGVMLTLDAGDDGITYFWNTGQNSQTIQVNTPGSYHVFVTNQEGCTSTDTINITMDGQLPSIAGIQISNNGVNTFHFTAVNPQNIIGYEWNFGDSDTLYYQASPVHTYYAEGNYTVTLKTSSTCGFRVDTTSANIVGIGDLGIDPQDLLVYPNPSSGDAEIVCKGSVKMKKIDIYNVLGQLVYSAASDQVQRHKLPLNGMASGLYTIQIKTDKGNAVRKLEIIQ
jgi:hypothetical protein